MRHFVMTWSVVTAVFAFATLASAGTVTEKISAWETNKDIQVGDKVFHWVHASDNLGGGF